jgi:hypothetical protein
MPNTALQAKPAAFNPPKTGIHNVGNGAIAGRPYRALARDNAMVARRLRGALQRRRPQAIAS